jgi:hypothetical protein
MASLWMRQPVDCFPVCDNSDTNAGPHCHISKRRTHSVTSEAILSICTCINVSVDAGGAA